MHLALALCALRIALAGPLPPAVEQLYRTEFGCAPPVWTPDLAQTQASLSDINDFFPLPKKVWPLLSFHQGNLAAEADHWLSRGVAPGILLPSDYIKVARDPSLIETLQRLFQDGAIMVLTVNRPIAGRFQNTLAVYVGLRLPPYALYISDGYDVDLKATLQPGTYLVAGHWYAHPEWPLPSREMSQSGRTYIPVYLDRPPSNGIFASGNISVRDAVFTPDLGLKRPIGPAVFDLTPAGLHTSFLGILEVGLLQAALPIITRPLTNLLTPLSVLSVFGWLMALSLILFAAVWLTFLSFRAVRWVLYHDRG